MINASAQNQTMYGMVAEFETSHELLDAARKAREEGYIDMKGYSPYEVHGLAEVLGHSSNLVYWLALGGLIVGGLSAITMMYLTSAVHYVLNVGGRPLNPWPAYIPITFEAAILFAGVATALFMFIRSGFPAPYHSIFNARGIENASRDRFFLCILVTDAKFHMSDTRQFLETLQPISVNEVAS